jgi:hypothetical protein
MIQQVMQNQSVEVSTLKFETDKSTQVNTLGAVPVLRKDAYMSELQRTCEELEGLLDKLESDQPKTHQDLVSFIFKQLFINT